MKKISLSKVRADDTKEKELFEKLYFDFNNSIFSLKLDSTDKQKELKFMADNAFISNPTVEDLQQFEKVCCEQLKKDINKAFFIIFNNEVAGFITADLSGTRSVLVIGEIGFEGGYKPTADEIDTIVKLAVDNFRKIKVVRVMNRLNRNTAVLFKKIGFEETCCLEKKVGRD